jgi:hypothetical protein
MPQPHSATDPSPRRPVEIAPTWGGFASIQVDLTECLLSDIAENAASFPYQRSKYLITVPWEFNWPFQNWNL